MVVIGKPHEYNLNGCNGETGAGLVLIDEATAKGEGLYHESASSSANNGFVCVRPST